MGRWSHDEMQKVLDDFVRRSSITDPTDRKRIRIVRAATLLFVRHGYRRTSVDEIARAAGVAKGTVYLYFPNKAHILLHAVAEEKRRYLGRIEQMLGGDKSPRERLRAWLRLALLLASEMPLVSRMLGADHEILHVFEELDPEMARWIQTMQLDFVAGFLHDATGDRWSAEELRERAIVLLGVSHVAQLITDEELRGGLPLEHFTQILADMLVDGVAPAQGDEAGR